MQGSSCESGAAVVQDVLYDECLLHDMISLSDKAASLYGHMTIKVEWTFLA